MQKDYYNILGITEEEKKLNWDEFSEILKKKYRKLCLDFHPDRQQGKSDEEKKKAEEKFKDIAEAYSVLSDQEKKTQYDNPASGFQFDGNYNDVVQEFMRRHMAGFGFNPFGGFGEEARPKADNRAVTINMTLAELMHDSKKTVKYSRMHTCQVCGGRGAEKDSDIIDCPVCHGRGVQMRKNGVWTIQTDCHNCGGSGKVIKKPCKSCNGSGMSPVEETLDVTIPAGAYDGLKIVMPGGGDIIDGYEPGSLIIYVREMPDKNFVRDGFDLHKTEEISAFDLMLGTKVAIDTLGGKKLSVSIPKGVDTSKELRLANQGLPYINNKSEHGDLFIQVVPKFPKSLTEEQEGILKKLKNEVKW